MPQNEPTRLSTLGAKLAVGAAVALVVGLFLLRAERAPDKPADQPQGTEAAKRSARVEERLQQLREAHARAQGGTPGTIEARAGVAATTPDQAMRRQRMAGPMGAGAVRPQPGATRAVAPEGAPLDDDPDDIPALKQLALNDPDPERRLAAVTMLGASDDPEAIPALAQALSDKDEEVRMAAIQSLGDFTGEVPVDVVETALNDQSADIRYEALEVLSDMGGDRARSAIERALNDPDDDVRSLAEGILDLDDGSDAQPPAGGQPPQPNQPPQPHG